MRGDGMGGRGGLVGGGAEGIAPRLVSMSATSSRVISPSPSRSSTWNASLISRTRAGGSLAKASV